MTGRMLGHTLSNGLGLTCALFVTLGISCLLWESRDSMVQNQSAESDVVFNRPAYPQRTENLLSSEAEQQIELQDLAAAISARQKAPRLKVSATGRSTVEARDLDAALNAIKHKANRPNTQHVAGTSVLHKQSRDQTAQNNVRESRGLFC
jgi:hypothetical protein